MGAYLRDTPKIKKKISQIPSKTTSQKFPQSYLTFHNPSVHQNFQPISAIFRGDHTLHGMHWNQMHSTIQHPNMYSLTIMQHNQRNTPVIMCPNNVFILQHLKMIPIFIWPCSTKIPFMSLCHIKISQTWYLSGANHMLHHKSSKYHTEITFKPF